MIGLLPVIPVIAPISDQNISIGRNATFLCNVTDGNTGLITYSWERAAVLLSNDDGQIEGAETDTLTIVNVTDSDEGEYNCTATNDLGNSTSNPAMLTIRKSRYIIVYVLYLFRLMIAITTVYFINILYMIAIML